ncbi:DNA mismatch repair endonuclease MutL [Niallia endozanthoxylica]|uniref:DNA mismatch repair protein MutL n=1 Tax=Niallia endozanthoxylica TaxID=2036016 RepID=A0A5J5HVV5_9BACI|nr:DNA mismatch repair endonuclease MutL [Niallia endozanthoxylica]KAA9025798.1 DNA mismatch repair endonuclease MutL [Niallia endozanthoxylica]
MGKIIQLDDALSNKIAAGEVVERPASVVKELVENAIDAGASIIDIEIEEAGLSKIRISDNGDGIEEKDVPMAFKRHATSKIKNEHDLFRIRTLGFRGEALPSIASVSKLELITSTGNEGTRIVLEGGKVTALEKAAARKGTDLTITDLFYNTPARLKYMKTVHTELGNITDVTNRLALAHPDVSIRLIHNERKLLHTTGNGDVRQVLAAIYGMNIAKKMIPLHVTSLDFVIDGYIALPEITRASRNYISTMINGRFIKNYPLVRAIQEGYHTLLPIGRFPIVLLNITMDPILVDVNVHPSKLEVRISKEQELNELITNSIKEAFKTKELIPAGFTTNKQKKTQSEQTIMQLDHIPAPTFINRDETEPEISVSERVSVKHDPILTDAGKQQSRAEETFSVREEFLDDVNGISRQEQLSPHEGNHVGNNLEMDKELNDAEERMVDASSDASELTSNDTVVLSEEVNACRVPPLYPIGQMHGTYILAQNDRGLYIIDQHAAQERIKYEFFKEKVGMVASELQELLVPITVEYSTDEAVKIEEYKSELEKVGVFLEPFGYNSYIVKAHPQWFPKGEEKEIIEDMIEQLLSMKKVDIKKLREEAAIMMSCKGSIKANRHLRNDEIQALLDELRQTSDPFTCPHGRPIIIHTSVYELEKMFKRVM